MRVADQILEARARVMALPAGEQAACMPELLALDELVESNPLVLFEPHSEKQLAFFEATTPIVAAFAGNRFGKTTSLVVRTIIECVDRECLPEHLRAFKRWDADTAHGGTFARIVGPGFGQGMEGVLLPAFRRWTPRGQFRGGSFDKAWDKQLRVLRFANGSTCEFMTYKQDVADFGGAARHLIGYDEPPPKEIRKECRMRLADYEGYEMFAMTPLRSNGVGWVRSEIYKQRESPDITVIRGSIHDNPVLSKKAVARALGDKDDPERRAREFGDFVEFGGLIYPDFDQRVVDPWTTDRVAQWDVIVGMDPGVRNAAMVWVGLDNGNVAHIFDERLIQDGGAEEYKAAIDSVNSKWGIGRDVTYVIDPAARSRAQTNAESMQSALSRVGIYCVHGQNQVDAGVSQIRSRLRHGRLWISRECVGIRDEADDYQSKEGEEFVPIKGNEHRLDAARYAMMHRPFYIEAEDEAPERTLGLSDVWPMPRRRAQPVPVTGSMT